MTRRPTRKHTAIASSESAAGEWVRDKLGMYLGLTDAIPVAKVRRVHVFRLEGESGGGLLAESEHPVPDRTGGWRTRMSAWVRRTDDEASYVLEAELNSWDAWTEAEATGDRRLVSGPRDAMYADRDRRTAMLAHELDDAHLYEVPAGSIPGLLAGLAPGETGKLASAFAPGLLGVRAAAAVG